MNAHVILCVYVHVTLSLGPFTLSRLQRFQILKFTSSVLRKKKLVYHRIFNHLLHPTSGISICDLHTTAGP